MSTPQEVTIDMCPYAHTHTQALEASQVLMALDVVIYSSCNPVHPINLCRRFHLTTCSYFIWFIATWLSWAPYLGCVRLKGLNS